MSDTTLSLQEQATALGVTLHNKKEIPVEWDGLALSEVRKDIEELLERDPSLADASLEQTEYSIYLQQVTPKTDEELRRDIEYYRSFAEQALQREQARLGTSKTLRDYIYYLENRKRLDAELRLLKAQIDGIQNRISLAETEILRREYEEALSRSL